MVDTTTLHLSPNKEITGKYRQFITFAHENAIDLRIAIGPSHARMFETLAVKGLWSTFENWKRQLVALNEEVASDTGKPPFPLWDFSGYNHYTTEQVPALDDRETKMNWYWETSHYKKEVGDLVLDLVLDHQEPGRAVHPDFGVLLTFENIEQHLQQIRIDRQKWQVFFPEDLKEIMQLAK